MENLQLNHMLKFLGWLQSRHLDEECSCVSKKFWPPGLCFALMVGALCCVDKKGVFVANKRALLERKEVLDTAHELLERFEAHLTAESQFTVNTLHLHFSFIFCCVDVLLISETHFFWCIWNILVILVCSHCLDLCFFRFFMGGGGGGGGIPEGGLVQTTYC